MGDRKRCDDIEGIPQMGDREIKWREKRETRQEKGQSLVEVSEKRNSKMKRF